MPTISRFYGIAIQMFYAEHGVAHFHARYAGQSVVIAIESLEPIAGSIPDRAHKLVREWAVRHQAELMRNWESARAGEPLGQIEPLS